MTRIRSSPPNLDLSTCDLSNRDPGDANLSHASVIGGYLPGATLSGTSLVSAIRADADLAERR